MKRIIPLVLLATAAIAVLFWSQRPQGPFFVSGFIEADEIRVGSRVGGRVLEVLADEGDAVAAGNVLVVLDAYDLHERRSQAQAELAARRAELERMRAGFRVEEVAQAAAARDRAKATLERLIAGPRPLEIQILEDSVAVHQAEFAKAEFDHVRITRLRENDQASDEEMQEATRVFEVARARVAQARDELALAREGTRSELIAEARADLARTEASLRLFEAGYRREDITAAESAVTAAEAVVAAIERQLGETKIFAPSNCVVEALDLQPGDLVAPIAPVVSLIDPRALHVRAYVPENRLNLTIDQKVRIRVDSFPGRTFGGRIVYISRKAEFTPSNVQTPEERSKQVFRIKIALEEGLDVLRAGMAADVILEPAP